MTDGTFRVGIIGTGGMGRNRARLLNSLPNVKLVGICGSSVEKAGPLAEEYEVKAYGDWKRFVEQQLDGICITTPNALHAQQATAALRHGKHVLCEYPLATAWSDLQRMYQAASSTKKVLGAGFNSLHDLRKLDRSAPSLGRPTVIYHDGFFGRSAESKWYWSESLSGGILILWAIDQIANVCHLFGRVKSIMAFETSLFAAMEKSKESFSLAIAFENGATGCIQTSINAPASFITLRAVYEKGAIDFMELSKPPTIYEDGKQPYRLDIEHTGLADDTKNWVESCLGKAERFPTRADVLHYHAVALAAKESARTGKPVDL